MKLKPVIALCLAFFTAGAQELPIKTEIPPIHKDPNVQFNVLHFDAPEKDKFSVIYFHHVYGSVLTGGEFVRDTGGMVFKDHQFTQPIHGSGAALLIRKQVVDGSGKQVSVDEWLLSQRALEGMNGYRLYFQKGFKHPFISNRTRLTQSIYNVNDMQGLSDGEMSAVVKFFKTMMPAEQQQTAGTFGRQPDQPARQPEKTIGGDIRAIQNQFKSLRATGITGRGDLPGDEKIQTRVTIIKDREFVITRQKKTNLLKFYITEDYKTYTQLDSARVDGDVLITSIATVYNLESQPVGAFANFHYKMKDEKGEEQSRQYSVAMDPDFKVHSWVHSTGKDKLNSLSAEICWFENGKLYVMSNNREKIFKPYAQLHEFTPKGDGKLLFPANEEEKGSEKTKYVENYQPPVPFNSTSASQAAPIPEKYVPVHVIRVGETKYFISQGTKYDEPSKSTIYGSVNIYRFEGDRKLTNIDVLGGYRGTQPFPMDKILQKADAHYFLLQYPVRVQLVLARDKTALSPLTDDKTMLVQKQDGGFIQNTANGSMLLRSTSIGNKLTVLYYPASQN